MEYKVVVTDFAKEQLESYIAYIINELKSKQGARAVLDDYLDTINILKVSANSLALLQDKNFAIYNYRRINFCKHRYFMLYRIVDNIVFVDAIYHGLQDYKNIIQ